MFSVGESVYRIARLKHGRIIKITGVTPGGNFRASDGNVYRPSGRAYSSRVHAYIKRLTKSSEPPTS